MLIIAFTKKTSKILPRIFCKNLRHCAPIIINNRGCLVMYQFTRIGKIAKIKLRPRDIKILHEHGWLFIYLPCNSYTDLNLSNAFSCVGLAKQAIGIRNIYIQTPDSLYKHLTRHR